jgi:hypothetical protein
MPPSHQKAESLPSKAHEPTHDHSRFTDKIDHIAALSDLNPTAARRAGSPALKFEADGQNARAYQAEGNTAFETNECRALRESLFSDGEIQAHEVFLKLPSQ